jgi:signal transduction histidine kinase
MRFSSRQRITTSRQKPESPRMMIRVFGQRSCPTVGCSSFRLPVAIRSVLLLVLSLSWADAIPARDTPYRVLVLHSFRNSLPVNTDWYRGIVRGFGSAYDLRIDIDIESLDLPRFSDPGYIADLVQVYRRKYAGNLPDLIIPTYTPALEFLLGHGEDLFPGVPVVFCAADSLFVAAREIPPYITGITTAPDTSGTTELALQLHPDARRMAVIVGSGELDRIFEQRARQALQPFEDRVELTWLRGMRLEELLAAVQGLPRNTLILYVLQLEDRTGESHFPFYTTSRLASVANAPIYGLWDTLIGHGIVGGRLITIEDDGFQAAQMGLRILRGEAPTAIPVVYRRTNPVILDGRELVRWNIGEDRLPADIEIRHRQRSAWEEHRTGIMTAVVIIVVQGLMIVALMLSRRRLRQAQTALRDAYARRSEAETIAARLRGRLARFSKQRSLGTMATTIAHEINQPLIAIQNYAQAARRRLQTNVDPAHKLVELFEKIEGQAERAGTITQRVRTLVSEDEPELHPVPLWALLQDVIRIMEPESEARGCRIACEHTADFPAVLADALQVQLVLVNLLRNALRSVCTSEESSRLIAVDARPLDDREVQVSVMDRGHGVSPERAEAIFEPLYSGTTAGMGMGLAICRDIIDAHGGRIWYEPNPAGGAIFRFTLRRAGS